MTPIQTPNAPEAIGPYSQAIAVGGFLFLSGQIPLDPATGQITAPADVAAQTEQVMHNLAAVLTASGLSLADLVKTTLYLADLNDFPAVNQVYARHLSPPFPARATVQVAALPRGARIEIDGIARLP